MILIASLVREALWDRLAGEDVEIAYPHTHHVFDDSSGRIPVALQEGVSESDLERALEQLPAERRGELLGEQEAD